LRSAKQLDHGDDRQQRRRFQGQRELVEHRRDDENEHLGGVSFQHTNHGSVRAKPIDRRGPKQDLDRPEAGINWMASLIAGILKGAIG